MNKIPNEYYICNDFNTLCGPYNTLLPTERVYLESVISDMKRGNINYRIVGSPGQIYVERTGMILPKSK
jgi:hypothetical protein